MKSATKKYVKDTSDKESDIFEISEVIIKVKWK